MQFNPACFFWILPNFQLHTTVILYTGRRQNNNNEMLFYEYYTFAQALRRYFFDETDPDSLVYIS